MTETPVTTDRQKATYSMFSTFRNCRKKAWWRYVRMLVPKVTDPVLWFGSLIHAALEVWYGTQDLAAVQAKINELCPARDADRSQRQDWLKARAMMLGYARRYPAETWKVVSLETPFCSTILNPATGAASRSFEMCGKVDGLVEEDGRLYILEHKTAGQVDGAYIDRLWADFQVMLYAHYIEESQGVKIAGVEYNILGKTRIQHREGESQAEYEERRGLLVAASKSGKTTARRQMPETDEEFSARLDERYRDPEMFHRERLLFSRDQMEELKGEVWELTQAWLDARRRGVWYMNTSYCFAYNKPCPYWQLCRSGGSEILIENMYETRDPHVELAEPPAEGPTF